MKVFNIRWFFILMSLCAISITSCVPTAGTNSNSRSRNNSEVDGGTVEDTTDENNLPPVDLFQDPISLYWEADAQFENIININSNFSDTLLLRGSLIHDYLKGPLIESTTGTIPSLVNSKKSYCLAFSYAQSVNTAPLRIYTTVHTISDLNRGIQYALKLNLSNAALNASQCNGSINYYSSSQEIISNTATGVFSLESVCPTCSANKTSQSISLYESNAGSISEASYISSSVLDLSTLKIRIDFSSSISETTSSCSNESCQAQGFDCCVGGIQCADDGELRPDTTNAFSCIQHTIDNPGDYTACIPDRNLSSYNNTLIQYGQAFADSKVFTTNNHLRYPNYYFTCSVDTPSPVTPPDVTPENPEEDAQTRLTRLTEEFNCLEEGKKDSPQFNSEQVCKPTFDAEAHLAIRLKVWKDCGCQADPFPTSIDDQRCPDFSLEATKDLNDNITNVVCYTPPLQLETPPFQELDLVVPNRSAPHRFFAVDGTEYEDLTNLNSQTITQEGDEFSYLDESSKQGPQFGGPGATLEDQAFGMNSILGRMQVALNRALPAKVVDVEFDQFYIISAHDGFYSPCPQCAADSWFPTFKAMPNSSKGLGIIGNGYTSSRSEYRDNYSLGNYEDSLFGRACWLPPTMLPYSHKPKSTSQEQRLERLKTQAAMYINGYQRDWFGFNQGALIGSFDGVSWFAVGKGRRIQAKSTKLYLAINAPFADLADPGTTSVSIVVDLGFNTAADFDFDPELEINHPEQNEGASCQSYHQCNTDTDCISQLGWEYSCVDVGEFKSNWPQFNVDGSEKLSSERKKQGFDQILHGGINGENLKRCVYRGMGAPCKKDFTTLNSARPELQKAFQCAPNFYCAEIASNEFNDNLIRTPNALSVYFFGQEADVLGRPTNYIRATRSLSSNIQENFSHNMLNFATDTEDFGLCRPGRSMDSADDKTNHLVSDSRGRTDYISQIGACDSSLSGEARTRSCPLIEMDHESENYLNIKLATATDQSLKLQQNMCGNESQYNNGSELKSTFEEIELEKLSAIFSLSAPGIPVDACLRRAGQVCFTDLDCGPNRLHSEQAIFLSTERFGGTEAEKKYWEESLVCSQAAEIPTLQDTNFFNYDLTQNRCCREVGRDFTMFSKIDDSIIAPDIGIDANLDLNIGTHTASTRSNEKRYSRYNNLELTNSIPADYTLDANEDGIFESEEYIIPEVQQNTPPAPFQWRTFQKTGNLNCCGGGWIRKFSDGTKNWSTNLRQSYSTSNFQCLNYRNTMHKEKPRDTLQGTYNKEKGKLCFFPDRDGCVQTPISDDLGEGFNLFPPTTRIDTLGIIDTTPTEQSDASTVEVSRNSPYIPIPVDNGSPFTSDTGSSAFSYWVGHHDVTGVFAVSFNLPIYIGGAGNVNQIRVRYKKTSATAAGSEYRTATVSTSCQGFISIQNGYNNFVTNVAGGGTVAAEKFCLQEFNNNLILHVAAANDPGVYAVEADDLPWDWAGVEIQFNPIGSSTQRETLNPSNLSINQGSTNTAGKELGMNPGNALYYLSKLGRFELMGIPQIFYEPLYCNEDKDKLVPGLFNSDITNRSEFFSQSFEVGTNNTIALEQIYDANYLSIDASKDYSALSGSAESRIVFQDKVALNQIFSGHEFRCCAKLGTPVSSSEKCCSGHTVTDDGSDNPENAGKLVCKLSKNTNLNVYFNRFVSSEGSITDEPEIGLGENDFVAQTGEPKLSVETYTKMRALGAKHCASGQTRQGAAFGNYVAQPNTGFFGPGVALDDSNYFSIVDSAQDFDPDGSGGDSSGFDFFIFGLRWDHHFYCN